MIFYLYDVLHWGAGGGGNTVLQGLQILYYILLASEWSERDSIRGG